RWVEKRLGVRYSVQQVGILPDCPWRIFATNLTLEWTGGGKAAFGEISTCTSTGPGEIRNALFNETALGEAPAPVVCAQSVDASGLSWHDGAGELAAAARLSTTTAFHNSDVVGLRLTSVADLDSGTVEFRPAPPNTLGIRSADLRGLRVLLDRKTG